MSASAPPPAARVALILLAIYAVFWCQFAVVRPENFGGIDEWMILSLASRGVLAVPYANRPLGLLFNLPAGLLPAQLLDASYLLHAHYLAATGFLAALLVLALAPHRTDWALLAGAFAATWAPADLLRLDAVYSCAYSGVAAASVLVFWVLARGSRRPVLVVVAAGIAFLATRVHEGPLPLLLCAPLLLLALGMRFRRWPLAFYLGATVLAALVAGLPLLRGRPESWYQAEVMGVYLDPAGVAVRLAVQFGQHLGPLVTTDPRELVSWRGLLGALALASALLRVSPRSGPPLDRRLLALAIPVGLLGAALAYSGFVLAARMAGTNRAQFLATPWVGLALASSILLGSSALPGRARAIVAAGCAAFVVATGAARVERLQHRFDRLSSYGRERSAVIQMLHLAPELKPGTLVLLLDHSRTWLGTFVFHHALDLAYGRGVAGCVPNARESLFYACYQDADGVRHEPWPILAEAWGEAPRSFRFDEIVAFRADPSGRLELLEAWPHELPQPPQGSRYAPRDRLDAPRVHPARRSLLERS